MALKHSVGFTSSLSWHKSKLSLYSDIDLKKAAKAFAQKFATGSSVTKNAQGLDEIVVQGDVSDEILEMIEGQVGLFKGIPAENVELVEEKKKKGGD
jgi:density-regulated protein